MGEMVAREAFDAGTWNEERPEGGILSLMRRKVGRREGKEKCENWDIRG
jgi:hypothetical protein